MYTNDELNAIDRVNDWLVIMRSYEVTYPEIAAMCGIKKLETFTTWAFGHHAPSPEISQRIQLAVELSHHVYAALGHAHRLGRVSQFFATQLKPLRNATPTDVILRDSIKSKNDLLLAVEHFSVEVKSGRLQLPQDLDRSNLAPRKASVLEEKESRAVRAAIQSLDRFLTSKEIGQFIGGNDQRVNLLRSQCIPRVSRLEKLQVEQAAAAATKLQGYYPLERVRQLLLGINNSDLYRGRSLAVLIGTQQNDRASQRLVSSAVNNMVTEWINRAKVRR